ncbi:MAG: reverse transcriptase domain-containing protein [Patescibacteria group bacterium]|jgi:hypothetical protein|nr:reverse transcriptase domain-containing protein [Patescibacteria group bacterium]
MRGKNAFEEACHLAGTCCGLGSQVVVNAIEAIQSSESGGYSTIRKPKSSGGVRILHEPCEDLKIVQSGMLFFFYRWSTDNRMFGFQPGRSPIDNARFHITIPNRYNPKKVIGYQVPRWILTVDLKDFFPSVTSQLLERMYRTMFKPERLIGYKGLKESEVPAIYEEFIRLMLLLTTHQGRLPQGAPTSPYLANLALASTGTLQRIEGLCKSRRTREAFRFSIYADDITISSRKDKISDRFIRQLITVIEQDGIFTVNYKKIRRNSCKYKAHQITGVVLTTDRKGRARLTLAQKTLKTLRGRVHRLRIQLRQAETDGVDFGELNQVIGHINWLRGVCQGCSLPSAVRDEVFAFREEWRDYKGRRKAAYYQTLRELEAFLRQLAIRQDQEETQRE